MVSLDHDSTRQGGYFFDGEGGTPSADFQNDDEELIPGNGLVSEESPKFRPIRAVWAAILQMIILVAHEVITILLPYVIIKQSSDIQRQRSDSFIVIVYLQTCVWLILLIFERYLHFAHRQSMRHGYLQFYRKTQKLKRVPLYTISVGNAGILVISGLFMDPKFPATHLWPVMYAQIIVTLEVILAMAGLLRYTVLVYHFNQTRSLPDVEQEEFNASITQPSATIPDIGYRDMGYLENLLERQADMIHYLKLHTAYLSKKILRLTRLTHPSGGNVLNSMQA